MYNKAPYFCFCVEMSNYEENRKKQFFSVCLISECASATINVYLYSVHLGIWNVTTVFHFPFNDVAGS